MGQNFRRLTSVAVAGASLIALRQWARRSRRIDFAGRIVVISGGSRGLGLELARQFAYEGAHLVLLARNEGNLLRSASELEALGARVTPIVCDVTRSRDVQQSVESILRQTGRIDVLINNAGIIQVGPFENMTIEDYQQSMRVHFCGPLSLIQQVVPVMQAARFGRIVNIASIGGKVAVPHLLPYVAGKFALVGLIRGFTGGVAERRRLHNYCSARSDAHRFSLAGVIQRTIQEGIRLVRSCRRFSFALHIGAVGSAKNFRSMPLRRRRNHNHGASAAASNSARGFSRVTRGLTRSGQPAYAAA